MSLRQDQARAKIGEVEYLVSARPYTTPNNPNLLGFIYIQLNVNNEVHSLYDSLRLVKDNNGNLFLSEPHSKAYQNKDGNITSKPYYLAPKVVKTNALSIIQKSLIEAKASTVSQATLI